MRRDAKYKMPWSIVFIAGGRNNAISMSTVEPHYIETSTRKNLCRALFGTSQSIGRDLDIVVNKNSDLWILPEALCRSNSEDSKGKQNDGFDSAMHGSSPPNRAEHGFSDQVPQRSVGN